MSFFDELDDCYGQGEREEELLSEISRLNERVWRLEQRLRDAGIDPESVPELQHPEPSGSRDGDEKDLVLHKL